MFKKTPLISIITPVFNRESLIIECIRSVQQQTFKNYEHIIIDDKSTDNTVKNIELIAKNDTKILLMKSDENSGGKPGKVRNIGIRMAQGKYVAFLDSDDIWREDKLTLQIQYMTSKDLDFSYHPLGRFENSFEHQTSFWGRNCHEQDFFRGLFRSNFIPTCSVMAKKKILEEVNLFNESLRYSEDYFLWLMIALKNYSIGFLNPVLGGFRRNKHGNINGVLGEEEKDRNNIVLKEKILFEYPTESIPRLMKNDLFYGYIFHYFQLVKNESDKEKRRALFSEAVENIFRLNLSKFFMKELDLLRSIRKI